MPEITLSALMLIALEPSLRGTMATTSRTQGTQQDLVAVVHSFSGSENDLAC